MIFYTAIFGPGFRLYSLPAGYKGICWTDQDELPPARGWEIQHRRGLTDGPRRRARRFKILLGPMLVPGPVSVWVDSRFEVQPEFRRLEPRIEKLRPNQTLAFLHSDRKTLFDEADAVIEQGKADRQTTIDQVAHYYGTGFGGRPVTATGLLIRRSTIEQIGHAERWWQEVDRWTLRDQLSFDYAAWVSGIRVTHLDAPYYDNPWMTHHRDRVQPDMAGA